MQLKNIKFGLFLVLLIFPIVTHSVTSLKAENVENDVINLMSDEGDLAPEFELVDVNTEEVFSLSDFGGKPVLINFFATWCSYCKDELPYLVLLHEIFGDDLQIISVAVDRSETQKQIADFSQAYKMTWLVGIDVNGTIKEDYNVGGIPHTVILNQDQVIYYKQIGFADYIYPNMKEAVYDLLPDTEDPIIIDFSIEVEDLSIYDNELSIFVNASDNREVSSITLALDGGNEQTMDISLFLVQEGKIYTVNQIVKIDPTFIYGLEEIDLKIIVEDFSENSVSTTKSAKDVEEYIDVTAPEVKSISIDVIDLNEDSYRITVVTLLFDDLMLVDKNCTLMIEDDPYHNKPLSEYNTTHFSTTFTISKTTHPLCKYSIKITVSDVSGKITEEVFAVPTDLDPTGCEVDNGDTPTVSFTTLSIIFALITLGYVSVSIVRKRF